LPLRPLLPEFRFLGATRVSVAFGSFFHHSDWTARQSLERVHATLLAQDYQVADSRRAR